MRVIENNITFELDQLVRQRSFKLDAPEEQVVRDILSRVHSLGDAGLLEIARKFEYPHLTAEQLWVQAEEVDAAHASISQETLGTLRLAIKYISDYHSHQIPQSWEKNLLKESTLGYRYSPLERVAVYVPGGRAPYPSSLLMGVIPARLAGVDEVIVTTPCGKDGKVHPLILAAAREVGVDKILRVGGAQALAALAFGTESIPKVDKIVGPGNIYVTLAKKLLYGIVDIDKLAGPSDVVVMIDATSNPRFAAAELLAQAEHDPLAECYLVSVDKNTLDKTLAEVDTQLTQLDRKEIASQAMERSAAFLVSSVDEAIDVVNKLAPEHLQIQLAEPEAVAERINHAGAIFVGNYSPVAAGDYLVGPNHVLPTGGTARFASPLSVADFVKASSMIKIGAKDLALLSNDIASFARLEGLDGHARSVEERGVISQINPVNNI